MFRSIALELIGLICLVNAAMSDRPSNSAILGTIFVVGGMLLAELAEQTEVIKKQLKPTEQRSLAEQAKELLPELQREAQRRQKETKTTAS